MLWPSPSSVPRQTATDRKAAPASDARARQAILYALNYEEICSTGMGTLATPATCFVQEGHPA